MMCILIIICDNVALMFRTESLLSLKDSSSQDETAMSERFQRTI